MTQIMQVLKNKLINSMDSTKIMHVALNERFIAPIDEYCI